MNQPPNSNQVKEAIDALTQEVVRLRAESNVLWDYMMSVIDPEQKETIMKMLTEQMAKHSIDITNKVGLTQVAGTSAEMLQEHNRRADQESSGTKLPEA